MGLYCSLGRKKKDGQGQDCWQKLAVQPMHLDPRADIRLAGFPGTIIGEITSHRAAGMCQCPPVDTEKMCTWKCPVQETLTESSLWAGYYTDSADNNSV